MHHNSADIRPALESLTNTETTPLTVKSSNFKIVIAIHYLFYNRSGMT